MNLHALRIFYNVAELRSFSKAAETLCISQPAVSKALKELENQLNIQLIERAARGKKLSLTDAGNSLFEHARSIFSIEQAALEDIRARTGLKKGTLVIGTSTTIAGYWLAPYLAKFHRNHPDIHVEVQVANTAKIEQALLACTIDIALIEGMASDPDIVSQPWLDEPMSIVVPANNVPLGNQTAWLSKQMWLLREPGSGTLQMSLKLIQNQGIIIKKSMQLGSNLAIARAVAQGIGVALLPNAVTEDLILLGKIVPLSFANNKALIRPLYQLHYKNRPSSPSAKAFETILYEK